MTDGDREGRGRKEGTKEGVYDVRRLGKWGRIS